MREIFKSTCCSNILPYGNKQVTRSNLRSGSSRVHILTVLRSSVWRTRHAFLSRSSNNESWTKCCGIPLLRRSKTVHNRRSLLCDKQIIFNAKLFVPPRNYFSQSMYLNMSVYDDRLVQPTPVEVLSDLQEKIPTSA
jgi:hypothetical protein